MRNSSLIVGRKFLIYAMIAFAFMCVSLILTYTFGIGSSDFIEVLISGLYVGIAETAIVTFVVALIARWRRLAVASEINVGRVIGLTIAGFLAGLLCVPIALLPGFTFPVADIQAWHGPIFLSPVICPIFGGIIGGMFPLTRIFIEEGSVPRILFLFATLTVIMGICIVILFIYTSIIEDINEVQVTPLTLPPTWTMTPDVLSTPVASPTP